MTTLTTDRLTLRRFTAADAPRLHAIYNGRDVLRYFPHAKPPDLDQVTRSIERLNAEWDSRGHGLWAVIFADLLVGRAGVQYLAETDEVEVDFIIDRAFWGRGIATEAGRAALAFGFDRLPVDEIVGIVHVDNRASQRVLTKIGMHETRRATYFGLDCFRYAIDRPAAP